MAHKNLALITTGANGVFSQRMIWVFEEYRPMLKDFSIQNNFGEDFVRFFERYKKPPQNVEELTNFVLEKYGQDPEAYFFRNLNEKSSILLSVPSRIFYEFANKEYLGVRSFLKEKPDGLIDKKMLSIQLFCHQITHDPRKIISEVLPPFTPSGLNV